MVYDWNGERARRARLMKTGSFFLFGFGFFVLALLLVAARFNGL